LRAALLSALQPFGRKVAAVVSYDRFDVRPDVLDAYVAMVREVAGAHYSQVSRYTTSAFLRAKLGRALEQRGVAPHIFDSADLERHRSMT
jgi:propionate CoA-transferase